MPAIRWIIPFKITVLPHFIQLLKLFCYPTDLSVNVNKMIIDCNSVKIFHPQERWWNVYGATCWKQHLMCKCQEQSAFLSSEPKCTNTGTKNVTCTTEELLYCRPCKSSCKWPTSVSVTVLKSHCNSLLVRLCTISDLSITAGSAVLPLAPVTKLMMGRWMKDIREDGNTGCGSNLSAWRENNFKDEDAPWEPPGTV